MSGGTGSLDSKVGKLENKIKWNKRIGMGFGALLLVGLGPFIYSLGRLTKIPSDSPEIYKEYKITEEIISKIQENKANLEKGTYFLGDTLLNQFSEQQLELDSLTKNRYKKFILEKIEKNPEFVEYNAQLKEKELKNIKGVQDSLWMMGLGVCGLMGSIIFYDILSRKKQEQEMKN